MNSNNAMVDPNTPPTSLDRRQVGLSAVHHASSQHSALVASNGKASIGNTAVRIPTLGLKHQASHNIQDCAKLASRMACPVRPLREASTPDLCSGSNHSQTSLLLEDLKATIPSLDRKAQTLLNMDGREFLHSSITSPMQPVRQPSNPNLCPSFHSRATFSSFSTSTLTSSDESELLLQAQIPSLDLKARTLLNMEDRLFLHSSMTSPIQPMREPSNPNLCPSLRSTRTCVPLEALDEDEEDEEPATTTTIKRDVVFLVNSCPEVCEPPTAMANSRQPLRMPSMHSTYSMPSLDSNSSVPTFSVGAPSAASSDDKEDEDEEIIQSEEEADDIQSDEDELGHQASWHKDITLDVPLLSPHKKKSSVVAVEPKSNTKSITKSIDSAEVMALKMCLTELGQRIEAMEAQQGIKESSSANVLEQKDIKVSWKDLEQRIEAIEAKDQMNDLLDGVTQKTMGSSFIDLLLFAMDARQHGSRNIHNAPITNGKALPSCVTSCHKDPSVGPPPGEKSKSRSRSSSTKTCSSRSKPLKKGSRTSSDATTKRHSRRSHSVDTPRMKRNSTSSSGRSESITRIRRSKSTDRKARSRSSIRKPTAEKVQTLADVYNPNASQRRLQSHRQLQEGKSGIPFSPVKSPRRVSQSRRHRHGSRETLLQSNGIKSENDVVQRSRKFQDISPRLTGHAYRLRARSSQQLVEDSAVVKVESRSPCNPSATRKGRPMRSPKLPSTATYHLAHYPRNLDNGMRMPVVGDLDGSSKSTGLDGSSKSIMLGGSSKSPSSRMDVSSKSRSSRMQGASKSTSLRMDGSSKSTSSRMDGSSKSTSSRMDGSSKPTPSKMDGSSKFTYGSSKSTGLDLASPTLAAETVELPMSPAGISDWWDAFPDQEEASAEGWPTKKKHGEPKLRSSSTLGRNK